MTIGLIAPTGVADETDTLQDIAFGDGQWDIFAEVGAGIRFGNFVFSSMFRYDLQLANTVSLRVPLDPDFTLSDQEDDFKVKLGDKIEYNIWTDYMYADWLTFTGGYVFNYQFATNVDSGSAFADSILEQETESYAHSAKFGIMFDTVGLYKLKKFVIPTQTELTVMSMLYVKTHQK